MNCEKCESRIRSAEERRNALLDRLRRQERVIGDLFRDVLNAGVYELDRLEAEVRKMEGRGADGIRASHSRKRT